MPLHTALQICLFLLILFSIHKKSNKIQIWFHIHIHKTKFSQIFAYIQPDTNVYINSNTIKFLRKENRFF